MKIIEKKSIVSSPEINGSISDTWNIENKTTNAPSIDLIQRSSSYSTTETFTGKYWIDEKPIYRKVVECGALPNAETKQVATGLSNVFYVDYAVMAISTSNKTYTKWPSLSLGTLSNGISVSITYDSINLITKADYTMFDKVYVTLYYTK